LKILHKEFPFGDNPERSRKGIYLISDNCYRFWYRYVFLNKTGIESGIGADIADSLVFPMLPTFIGKPVFEDICRQYLILRNKEKALPILATNFGTWWGNDPKEKKNTDIDIVADNKIEKNILLCECKWKEEPTGSADIQKLISKANLISGYNECYFAFFSKSSYTDASKRLEKENEHLRLLTYSALFEL
jgi:AAA+ ATPase superfamily predicted ATPase